MITEGKSIKQIGRGMAMLITLLHLFIGLSYTFFIHTHILESGHRIVHSHPLAASDNRSEAHHHHDISVYQVLPDLTNTISETPDGLILENSGVAEIGFQYYTSKPVFFNRKLSLRGPPHYCL